jgi:energy-coupling factor transport system permease protein
MIKLDPRTMLFLLVIGNLSVFFVPSMQGEGLISLAVIVLAFLCGVIKLPLRMGVAYYVMLAVDYLALYYGQGGLILYIALFARFLRKVIPCGILGVVLVKTTKVNEFMTALLTLGTPRKLLIPLTVMLRYFPAIAEDGIKIKKAMKMRGLTPSLKGFLRAPAINIECVYVPLMMSGARRADELSAAAISRGIENPAKRTSYQLIGFKTADVVCITIAILLLLYTWRGL